MGRVVWSVRESKIGQLDAPKVMSNFRAVHPVHEPKIGEVLHLPDGSGSWRVVDWMLTDRVDAPGNVLVVERIDAEST